MNRADEAMVSRAGTWSHFMRRTAAGVGGFVHAQWEELRHAAAVIGTVLWTSVRPRYWMCAVRTAFARQVLTIGVEPLWFVSAVAVFVGISVVVHLAFWVGEAGQSQLLGPLLVAKTGAKSWNRGSNSGVSMRSPERSC